jgi:hypothetical protein
LEIAPLRSKRETSAAGAAAGAACGLCARKRSPGQTRRDARACPR